MTELFAQQLLEQPNRRQTLQRIRQVVVDALATSSPDQFAADLRAVELLKNFPNQLPLRSTPQDIANHVTGPLCRQPDSLKSDALLKFLQRRSNVPLYPGAYEDLRLR